MSFIFTEFMRRERLSAGLYGVGSAPGAVINLVDASTAGRLWVELLVYDPVTFYPGQTIVNIEKDLADKTLMSQLFTGVTGLAKHGGANYARKAITASVFNRNTGLDRIELVTTPNAWTWDDLDVEPNGWGLRYAVIGYDAGSGDYIPCVATAEDIIGKLSTGDDFTLSVPIWWAPKHST